MKAVSATAFLAVLTYPFALGQTIKATGDPAEQAAVVRVMNEVADAYAGRDHRPFEKIFVENYVGVRDKPAFDLREQLIAMMRADSATLKAGKRPDFQTLTYENTQIHVNLYGNTAVATATKKNLWRYGDRKCLTSIQATELWVKRGGEWKAAASHATNFHCDPKPYHPTHPAIADMPAAVRPVNSDRAAEQEIRDFINALVRARAAGSTAFSSAASEATTSDFLFTAPDGRVDSDRNSLSIMPAAVSARSPASRNSDDGIVIFDSSAIYTFRVLETSPQESTTVLKRGTVFLVKTEGGWKAAAFHLSSH